ncbi:hypothetical protein OEZ49_17940 [Ruegeria sp. WL0004]|uniref:Uncharacterized protein n=1 Tax=Ruegeria marisflavi TaxID=2984152 RepID=A0ABT2WUS2_9RHOB|nr:hypothetical protein [Ruegeria sp. WL0004]
MLTYFGFPAKKSRPSSDFLNFLGINPDLKGNFPFSKGQLYPASNLFHADFHRPCPFSN